MKAVAIIQARLASTRLPQKVLKQLGHQKVLDWVINAAKAIPGVDEVMIATSNTADDEPIASYCAENRIAIYRGDLDNVLKRYVGAAREIHADYVLRITADCPFLDPQVCGSLLRIAKSQDLDYVSNILTPTWPDGLDCEVIKRSALEASLERANKESHTEHVTQYILTHQNQFSLHNVTCPISHIGKLRWTLDSPEDYSYLEKLAAAMPKDKPASYLDILSLIDENPGLKAVEPQAIRNEGLIQTNLKDLDAHPEVSFKASKVLLERAEKTIPLGSQTFSKSRIQYPAGFAPLYLTHGRGGRVWDVDGNEYVDMVNALLPNILGYCDEDVNRAIEQQLSRGISFSLATELEVQLSEKLVELIPCAEMVRLGKNGSDATTAAVRIARAYTKKEMILACGYHGWHDWYIGRTTMNAGVPEAVQKLTQMIGYNNLDGARTVFDQHKGKIAGVILEATNFVEPNAGFLQGLKDLCEENSALLIFDEVITGFRFALGGAQSIYCVTPHLAAFGKSMANGMPCSALVGQKDILKLMEEVFISTTFGGETLSIAAALATIEKMESENVIDALWAKGKSLRTDIHQIIQNHNLSDAVSFVGKDPWQLIQTKETEGESPEVIKTFILYGLHTRGVLSVGSHNICFAHDQNDWEHLLNAYDSVFKELAKELSQKTLSKNLKPPISKPLFKVR